MGSLSPKLRILGKLIREIIALRKLEKNLVCFYPLEVCSISIHLSYVHHDLLTKNNSVKVTTICFKALATTTKQNKVEK